MKFDDDWVVNVLYRIEDPHDELADPLDQRDVDAKHAIDASGSCEAKVPDNVRDCRCNPDNVQR